MRSLTNPGELAARLAQFEGQSALIGGGAELTYRALADRVNEVADRLGTERRLVLIEAENDIDGIVNYLGALSAGNVVLLAGSNNQDVVATYDPDVVIASRNGKWATTEIRRTTAHDLHPDLALLLSTSGSTGSPKLVRLSYRNLLSNAASIAGYLHLTSRDRAITTLPPYYCYGLSVLHSHLLAGASIVLNEHSVVDREFWDEFRRWGCTSFAGVPHTFDLLDRTGFDEMELPSLRYVTQAGGRLGPDRVRHFAELGQRRGWDLYVMYGATEATARMGYLPPDLAVDHPGSIGVAVPGGHFDIDDSGELIYSGPNVMMGYAERGSDLGLGRTVDRLRTGDLARFTKGGLVEIIGRKSRFAKIFGLRIDLQRIESELAQDGITACCAESDGTLVVAVEGDTGVIGRVAAISGLPRSAIKECAVDAIPRLPSGKPDYPTIRMLGAGLADISDVQALFADVVGIARDEVSASSTFVDLGGDSLSYVTMSVRLERLLGHLPPNWHTTPVGSLRPAARRSGLRSVETSLVLRAVAIVLVVGSHAGLFALWGGAHVLLSVAGFNFARFVLTGKSRVERVRHALSTVVGIAVPSILWIGVVMVAGTHYYGVTNLLLMQKLLGPDGPTQGHLWFIEIIVQILLLATAVVAIPQADRLERHFPMGFALSVLAVALLVRFDALGFHSGDQRWSTLHATFFFVIGWAAAKAVSNQMRLVVTVAATVSTMGYFTTTQRDLIVLGGIVLLIWLPTVRVPAFVIPVLSVLAGASLYIYLVHWQILDPLAGHPVPAIALSLVAGIAGWWLVSRTGSISGRISELRRAWPAASTGPLGTSRR
ncbi:MAG: AMP-binding protein [Nocardiaceae bacterium]|nr:AMP-binding protein [Nocardiaceae bacterium]